MSVSWCYLLPIDSELDTWNHYVIIFFSLIRITRNQCTICCCYFFTFLGSRLLVGMFRSRCFRFQYDESGSIHDFRTNNSYWNNPFRQMIRCNFRRCQRVARKLASRFDPLSNNLSSFVWTNWENIPAVSFDIHFEYPRSVLCRSFLGGEKKKIIN